jgi:hypothetical protein
LLVHEQQRFKCATHIAVAAGYNLIDNDVGVIYNTAGYGARHGYILELMTNSLHPFRLDVSFCTLFTGRKPITFSEMLGLARRRAAGLPGDDQGKYRTSVELLSNPAQSVEPIRFSLV